MKEAIFQGGPGELRECSLAVRFVRKATARRYILRLEDDGTVRVTVPRGGSYHEAQAFVEEHRAWIWERWDHWKRHHAVEQWQNGARILFRGTWEAIQVREEAGLCHVRLGSETWTAAGCQRLKDAVEEHLREMAARELPCLVRQFAQGEGLRVARVSIRDQQSRWGSCSVRGNVSLNWRLVQTPVFVRDYIVWHELVHLKVMNHSRHFWCEVARLFPEFEEAERWLRRNGRSVREVRV